MSAKRETGFAITPQDNCFLDTAISAMTHYGATADMASHFDDGHNSFYTSQLRSRVVISDTILELLEHLKGTEEVIANMTPPSN